MRVLSLFDGISCGRAALERAGIEVEDYSAFEIDKYAIAISEKNYPEIRQLNRQFLKITKNKPSFTSDDSLRRILYLASKNIVSHWTVICRNWDMVSNQLSIMFADRETA